jgi:ribosomal-protein-alanine N-acetyltransferase
MPTVIELTLRLMHPSDLSRVLDIERHKPGMRWTRQDFQPVFEAWGPEGWVAAVGGRIVGFLIFEAAASVSRRRCLTVLNIAVVPSWQRQGVASALLESLAKKLPYPEDCVQATVPESNLPVQLLLRSTGYKAVKVVREFFDTEDGYRMERQRDAGQAKPT